jgi:hypothetical protein
MTVIGVTVWKRRTLDERIWQWLIPDGAARADSGILCAKNPTPLIGT